MKTEVLAARTDGLRDVLRLGGGQHEYHVPRRFLQGFKQGIKGGVRNLMGFVKNPDFEAVAGGAIAGGIAQLADLVNAAVCSGVNLNHVHRVARAYLSAGFANPAGFGNGMVGRAAVQRHGQNARHRSLADSPVAAKDVTMGNALLLDGVLQSASDVLLSDHFRKALRTVLARQDLVSHRGENSIIRDGDTRFWLPKDLRRRSN